MLTAPFGPSVYELHNRASGELVLVGEGRNVAFRMSLLLPPPLGAGTRRISDKRAYVLEHLADLDYRTIACKDKASAKSKERQLRSEKTYRFWT